MAFYMYLYSSKLIDRSVYEFAFNLRYNLIWFFFSLSWILVIFFIFYITKNKRKLLIYNIMHILMITLFVVQICYCQEMHKFMVFSDLFVAGEGLQYIASIIPCFDYTMGFIALCNILILIAVNKLLKDIKTRSNHYNKLIIFLLLVFIVSFRLVAYVSLGYETKDTSLQNKYETNYNAKDIYNDYINPNTSMYVSGLYEYGLRTAYKYFYNLITIDKDALKEEIDVYNSLYNYPLENNDYTGIFKDKNVIYVLMESVDSWAIDDDTMPTLNKLKNTGLNFTNRYSPFFNGGQTINSEFSMNTGLYAITDYDTIFDIDTIDYNYSMANVLKKNGYNVNSFHANTGKFYNRREFHKLLGYDNHYSAVDLQKEHKLNKNKNYFVDSNFIIDEYLSNLVLNKESKFLSFITTYSGHLDYNKFNKVFKETEGSIPNKYDYEEEYIYRTLVNDTDKFLKVLIEKLESTGLIDNTVLVLVADHYSYGYSDSEYVANKKGVNNDPKSLQNTPVIIWSKDIEHKNINTIMDTADILPTLLNMLGIEYNPMSYIGEDVFSNYHDNFIWFSDGSIFSDNKNNDKSYLAKANLNIIKNRNILLTNYYGVR